MRLAEAAEKGLKRLCDRLVRINALEREAGKSKQLSGGRSICDVMEEKEVLLEPFQGVLTEDVEDDGEFKELITKLDINIIDLSEILKYQLDDAKKVNEYYFKSNYKDKIINLFRMYGFLNRKGVLKKRLKK